MAGYSAMLFDLDDTLLDRDRALNRMFSVILDSFYVNAHVFAESEMRLSLRHHDNRGYGDKVNALNALFDEFPPQIRMPDEDLREFWEANFPPCFTVDDDTIALVERIKKRARVAIVTNGSSRAQRAKIAATNLHTHFDTIVISEEAGFWKPDRRIFDLALDALGVPAADALFVGDNLVNDIRGCQSAGIKGVWFNPGGEENASEIAPYAQIRSLGELMRFFPQ